MVCVCVWVRERENNRERERERERERIIERERGLRSLRDICNGVSSACESVQFGFG